MKTDSLEIEPNRMITATIRVVVHVHDRSQSLQVSQYRKRDLEDWLKRHRKDIENEMAYCDEVSIDVVMGFNKPEEGK